MNEREELLKQVQMTDFALLETVLFLDTHPTDKTALEYYDKYRKLSEQAREKFTEKYGPLQSNMMQPSNRFVWVDNPWPWEVED